MLFLKLLLIIVLFLLLRKEHYISVLFERIIFPLKEITQNILTKSFVSIIYFRLKLKYCAMSKYALMKAMSKVANKFRFKGRFLNMNLVHLKPE